ncbi:MAG: hypothetical protein Q8R92_08560 [Deltaproteobacteria bacterium]|nr:hypothetical protein [Deltaproteobacteria bacterium]
MKTTFTHLSLTRNPVALEARAARGIVETAFDRHGWPWSGRISLWLDALVLLEEHE